VLGGQLTALALAPGLVFLRSGCVVARDA